MFAPYAAQVEELERSLQSQREYLRATFNDLAPEIGNLRAQGTLIVDCMACGFASAAAEQQIAGLFQSTCLVCRARSRTWFLVECVCGAAGEFGGDGEQFVCSRCGAAENVEELVARLNEEFHKHDEESLALTPANCGQCDGYHTVIEHDGQYLCLQCLDSSKTLGRCEWCSECSTGELGESYLLGCGNCEGHAGWHKDDA